MRKPVCSERGTGFSLLGSGAYLFPLLRHLPSKDGEMLRRVIILLLGLHQTPVGVWAAEYVPQVDSNGETPPSHNSITAYPLDNNALWVG